MFRVDAMNNIYMTRGDDIVLTVYIANEDGTPYTMSGTDTLILTARDSYSSSSIAFSSTATGTNVLSIPSSATANIPARKYVYDVELRKAVGNTKHTIIGPDGHNNPLFTLLEDVTR